MIEVRSLSKNYGDFVAVRDINFEIKKGEILGIVGPNGAGKTTILKMLVGLIEPSAGSIRIAGYDAVRDGTKVKEILGFLPEESPAYEDMSIEDYLLFFAEIFGIERKIAEERIYRLLNSLKLYPNGKKIGELSKGMRRKVVIARSLINDPDVLVYDEPTSGLDPMTSHFIVDFIKSLRGKKTILLSTHNLFQAEEICGRLLLLKDGREIACGTTDELRQKFGKAEYSIRYALDAEIPTNLKIERENGCLLARSADLNEINSLAKKIVINGGKILSIDVEKSTLEDIFMKVME